MIYVTDLMILTATSRPVVMLTTLDSRGRYGTTIPQQIQGFSRY